MWKQKLIFISHYSRWKSIPPIDPGWHLALSSSSSKGGVRSILIGMVDGESCAPGCAMRLLPRKKPFTLRSLATWKVPTHGSDGVSLRSSPVNPVMRSTIKYCLALGWQMSLTTFCFSNIWCSSPELPNAPCLSTRTGRVTCHPPHGSLQKTAQAKSFQSLWSWRDSKSNSEAIRVRAFWARDHYL